jgi:hypothetical protein
MLTIIYIYIYILYIVIVHNYEVTSDRCNIVAIGTNGEYVQKWIVKLCNYMYKFMVLSRIILSLLCSLLKFLISETDLRFVFCLDKT